MKVRKSALVPAFKTFIFSERCMREKQPVMIEKTHILNRFTEREKYVLPLKSVPLAIVR
jgi:hypothetical protein